MKIKSQGHSLTIVQGHSDSFSNLFSLENARPIEAKFHVEPPWDGRTKVCSNCLGHMTNKAAMLIYGKCLKNILLWSQVDMQHRVLEYYQVYSNDDPGLTLTYLKAMSNLGSDGDRKFVQMVYVT